MTIVVVRSANTTCVSATQCSQLAPSSRGAKSRGTFSDRYRADDTASAESRLVSTERDGYVGGPI